MANTVPILNFTNTFGDLLAQQNRQSVELNNLAANNYTKDSGTLILNGAGTGLSVTEAAILGSSIVSRTLSVIGDTTALSNVFINGSGFTLDVANSAIIRQNIITNQITANTLIRATTINASGNVFVNDISSNNLIRTTTLTASGNAIVNTLRSNTSILGATLNVTGQALTNSLRSNTSIEGSTLAISSSSITDTLQANSSVNTAIVTATQNIIGNNIRANTGLSSTTLSVSGLSSVDVLQANSSVNTATISVTGTGFVNSLQANSSVNTATISVTGTGFVNSLQANSSVNTAIVTATNISANIGLSSPTLSVSGTTRTGVLIANTSITVPTLTVTTKLDANTATEAYFDNLQTTGQLSVGGNFVINGTTVYNTNNFTINAGSATGQNSLFGVNRGSSGANAAIRWNETSDVFETNNVNNGIFYRVLTDEYLSSSTTSASTSNVATSAAVLQLQNVCNTQNTAIAIIQGVDATQNTNITALNNYSVTAFNRANTSSNTFIGTTGTANATSGVTTLTSTNGMTIVGSANTLTINTPQDLRTSASPTFNGLTLSNALALSQGGTSATSAAQALTNLLPTGTIAGYVLTTGGPGTFYWAPGGTGGGGGAVPGTTINSTRLSYTGNGSGLAYTTPTYIPGSSQLRVYFDGVRQFASGYTETSNSIVTFTTSPPTGTAILIEVDGYIINPYYANNISFTTPQGSIPSSANTIQLAIQDLESRKAALSSATFTGLTLAPTPATSTSNTQVATTAFVHSLANSGTTFSHSITGNAGSVTNGVYTSGDQTISGTKTFNSTISGSINGNAATATNAGTAASCSGNSATASNPAGGGSFITTNNIGSQSVNFASSAGAVAWGNVSSRPYPTTSDWGYSGQSGQPSWLWGTNDGNVMRVWNPSNFSVNYANSAGSAGSATNATNLVGGTLSCSSGEISSGAPTLWLRDTDQADFAVHVNSNLWYVLNEGGGGIIYTDASGNFTAVGNITAFSDERVKTNWRPVQKNFVSKLANIKSGIYNRTDIKDTQVGVSAQSLQTLMPEAVQTDKDGMLSVNYGAAAMVSAIELAKEIALLRAEIAELKNKGN
jgi:hypothetical protein